MFRPEPDPLHPRLTVVPIVDGARAEAVDGPGRTVVGRDALLAATRAVADRRRAALQGRLAQLHADLDAARSAADTADAALARRQAARDELIVAAAWCEELPAVVAGARTQLDRAEAELAQRARDSREAARALDRVLEQRASADAAIGEAHRQLRALHAGAVDADGERRRAAEALAAQAESVETRLREAEADARERSDRTKRAVTEAERTIEQLASDLRRHHARLRTLVADLPADDRPPHDDDPLRHVDQVASALRGQAEIVDADLPGLTETAARHRTDAEHRGRDLAQLAASLEGIIPEDAAEALAGVWLGAAADLVVLDDVVAPALEDADDGYLRALERTDGAVPVVLLSSDPVVLGWAIDLPAARGAVVGPRTVELLTAALPTALVPPRQPATSSIGDHA